MIVLRPVMRSALAGALLLLGADELAAQRQGGLALLDGIERGQWLLRESAGGERRLCVGNPAMLLQIEHGRDQCEHFVMSQARDTVTIRYTCPNHGHGRTTISVETPRLIRIETQGVADGAPFSEEFEARRAGNCVRQR